jgi:GNAT superfamily N-acetyltransferase
VHLRELRGTDLGDVRDLLLQLGYDVSPEALARRLQSVAGKSDHLVLVAEDAGRAVGLIHAFERPSLEKGPEAVVQAMVVHSGSRRNGVGDALLRKAEAWAAARGLGTVSLHTRADRADAHAFYARSGYRKVAAVSLMRKDTTAI